MSIIPDALRCADGVPRGRSAAASSREAAFKRSPSRHVEPVGPWRNVSRYWRARRRSRPIALSRNARIRSGPFGPTAPAAFARPASSSTPRRPPSLVTFVTSADSSDVAPLDILEA